MGNASYDAEVVEDQPTVNYVNERIIARWDAGLLSLFECSVSGETWIDPVGRNGKHEFLCEKCADPEAEGECR